MPTRWPSTTPPCAEGYPHHFPQLWGRHGGVFPISPQVVHTPEGASIPAQSALERKLSTEVVRISLQQPARRTLDRMNADSMATITLYDRSGRIAERHDDVPLAIRGSELVFGAPMRRRIPLLEVESISSEGDDLVLSIDDHRLEVMLGDVEAETWADGLRSLVDALAPGVSP